MAVIIGITRAVDIGRKIYQVYRRTDKRLQRISPANQFINRYSPPGYRKGFKQAYRAGEIALGGKLIYDLLNQGITDAIPKKQRPTSQYRKTRNNIYGSSKGRFYRSKYNACPSRYRFRKKY